MASKAYPLGWGANFRYTDPSPRTLVRSKDQPMPPLRVTPRIVIGEDELVERFIQASGPGGQNVNKVASAAQLRFDVANSGSLTDDVRERLTALAGRRMTQAGVLVITARRFRTQDRNRADARERLAELIRQAAKPPILRRPTRPTAASRRNRASDKKSRSVVKQRRNRPELE
jgi:ribosome-associated protein